MNMFTWIYCSKWIGLLEYILQLMNRFTWIYAAVNEKDYLIYAAVNE